MRRARVVVALVMGAVLLLVGCGRGGARGATPQPGGPAFEMTIAGEAHCPAGLDSASCVRVTIINRGTTGDGRCRLRGFQTAADGAEEDIWGHWIELDSMRAGESIVRIVPWDASIPAVGYCEPALTS